MAAPEREQRGGDGRRGQETRLALFGLLGALTVILLLFAALGLPRLRRGSGVASLPTETVQPTTGALVAPESLPAVVMPSPTPTTPSPLPQTDVRGPAAYPGVYPYLGAVEVSVSGAGEPLTVTVDCTGALYPVASGGDGDHGETAPGRPVPLAPGQTMRLPLAITPGGAVDCEVMVDDQPCGQWRVEPDGVEEEAEISCVPLPR